MVQVNTAAAGRAHRLIPSDGRILNVRQESPPRKIQTAPANLRRVIGDDEILQRDFTIVKFQAAAAAFRRVARKGGIADVDGSLPAAVKSTTLVDRGIVAECAAGNGEPDTIAAHTAAAAAVAVRVVA